ncbi:LacI family DNA-binding transcriptional regulator [Nakamurella antarctica]|uniref:LacI family DNA-binding transcriptional regulator n=1 Tax=Nakamurella antarctica TaxID=1902245 RepID=UPI0019D227B1|nr:LacI family DNA-binding transcriptional regulator [Nakamurella antarctica]
MTDTATNNTASTPASASKATLDSVAKLACVSRQTVSNVMNSPALVKAETAERVHQAIKQLGYRPNLAAKRLRTGQSRLIGLRIVGVDGDAVFDRFLHALTDAAALRDYRIILYTSPTDAGEIAAFDELLDRWDIDGIVLTSTHRGDVRTDHLATKGIPCVTFGRPWDDSDHHSWVDVDGRAGTKAATETLIAAGHRRIGFLGWQPDSDVGNDREAGWREAMREANLDCCEPVRRDNTLDSARMGAREMLAPAVADSDLPVTDALTAVVCVSDVMALGMLAELAAQGRPTGISIVGFDNSTVAASNGLSSVDQPLVAVADHCARLLIDQIERPSGATAALERILLPPKFIPRASSRPPDQ